MFLRRVAPGPDLKAMDRLLSAGPGAFMLKPIRTLSGLATQSGAH